MPWARQSKGGLWGGVYRAPGNPKPIYLPCEHRTKTEAKRAAALEEDRAHRRPGSDPHGPRTLYGTWCDEWWPTRNIEASTRASQTSSLRRVRDRWDRVQLGMITRHGVQSWVNGLLRNLSPASIRQPYYLLASSLDAAVEHRLIDVSPCSGIALPVVPPAQERFLTADEVEGLREHLHGQWRLLLEILLGTGLRIGEAAGLHWHRVDLDAGVLRVVETWSRAGKHVKAYPKSRRLRSVPLTDDLVERLRAWRVEHPPAGSCGRAHVAFGPDRTRRRPGSSLECRSSLVITGDHGAPVDSGYFGGHQWAAAVEAAGIAHCTPHSTRHTYASRLLTAGVPIARVSKLLGHSSIKVTERYAHVMTEGFDEVRSALATSDQSASSTTRHLRSV